MKNSRITWILIVGVIFWLFSYILDSSANSFFKNFDISIFSMILSIITNFGFVITLMVLVPTLVLYKKNKRIAHLLWANFLVSLILTIAIKMIIGRHRPIETFTYPFTNIPDYSFPSMHAVVAFSLLAILNEYLPRQRTFWTYFAFLVALSRVYFGVHYLSDVVSGALLGYFIGHCMSALYKSQSHAKNKRI